MHTSRTFEKTDCRRVCHLERVNFWKLTALVILVMLSLGRIVDGNRAQSPASPSVVDDVVISSGEAASTPFLVSLLNLRLRSSSERTFSTWHEYEHRVS